MRHIVVVSMLCVLCGSLVGCQSSPDGVMNTVLVDFGLREKPEGYVSGSDKIYESLNEVGATEMKRMNLENQHGAVKFQQEGDYRGKYYKEVKVYESFYPIDVRPVSRSSTEEGGYNGYLQYTYRVYQSARKDSRTDAEAETADIATDETGDEVYRYSFSTGGAWNGSKGQKSKK